MPTMEEVLNFWFVQLQPADWYKKSDELDERIRGQFESLHARVVAGETAGWRDSADGRLAEIIVLDQFSRNMFRATPAAFAFDPLALALAQEMIRAGQDVEIDESKRAFVCMPFMHSESPIVHEQAMTLFAGTANLEFEVKHKEIFDRFGRYPHRNEVLGRPSTEEEVEWMKTNKGF